MMAGSLRITSILPLSSPAVETQYRHMDINLVFPGDPAADGARDRALARLLGPSLDRELALGLPPWRGGPRAARARFIVSPAGRRQLIRGWNRLLDQARRPPSALSTRGPLCRRALAAAEHDVRSMLGVVAAQRPIAARGAAMARVLLTDGAGPLYHARSGRDLGEEVRDVTRWLTESGAEHVFW
jgi:hypothetical protein